MFRLSNLPCPLDQALELKALIARALGLPLGRIARPGWPMGGGRPG